MPSVAATTAPLHETHRRGRGTRDWMVDARHHPLLARRGVMWAGYSNLGTGYTVVRTHPPFAHIGLCCAGRVDYLINGRWTPAPSGTVLIAPRGVPHGSRSVVPSRSASSAWIAWVMFEQGATPRRANPAHSWQTGNARLRGPEDHRPLWWALQGLYVETAGRADPIATTHWADLIVDETARLATGADTTAALTLRRVWERVDADLRFPWSVATLAQLAFASPTHLTRLCAAQLNRSPLRQVTHLRMQRAAMLLRTTHRKLPSVATEVGYHNSFAFSVAFKRWSGTAPADFRSTAPANGAHLG